MGWHGAGTAFDVLPVLISAAGEARELFDVPSDAVLEVPIGHPEYGWFADLACVGTPIRRFPVAPFSGWYVNSEIGARNLSDHNRYNMLPIIAAKMGLATKRDDTLRKDRALVELSGGVLWSYRQAGVYIVDHHTVAAQFVSHIGREERCGRKVAADWARVNPPLSASTTPSFHRSFDSVDFSLGPNFYSEQAALAGCPVEGQPAARVVVA